MPAESLSLVGATGARALPVPSGTAAAPRARRQRARRQRADHPRATWVRRAARGGLWLVMLSVWCAAAHAEWDDGGAGGPPLDAPLFDSAIGDDATLPLWLDDPPLSVPPGEPLPDLPGDDRPHSGSPLVDEPPLSTGADPYQPAWRESLPDELPPLGSPRGLEGLADDSSPGETDWPAGASAPDVIVLPGNDLETWCAPLFSIWRILRPPARYRGPGEPLLRSSWQNRPLSASWFMGAIWGDELIDRRVRQGEGFIGGYQLGWDFDEYFGAETRFVFGSMEIHNEYGAQGRRGNDILVWDVDLLYYPWGDARWRPYLLFGLGIFQVDFDDDLNERVMRNVLSLPLGVGLKYRWNQRIALRLEVLDNMALGGGSQLDDMHNVSLTGGMELRFGGRRPSYWPWNPSNRIW